MPSRVSLVQSSNRSFYTNKQPNPPRMRADYMAAKRTKHPSSQRPPGYRYPSEIERRNINAVARITRLAAEKGMTPAAFVQHYADAPTRPAARRTFPRPLTVDRGSRAREDSRGHLTKRNIKHASFGGLD
jgi:hypothetical protein